MAAAKKKVRRQKPMRQFSAEDVALSQDVKRANQRLRQLEMDSLTDSPAYRAIQRLWYKGDDAISTTKHGEMKFSTNIRSMTPQQREHLRAEVGKFLRAQTSTKKGINALYKKAMEAYRQKGYGEENKKSIIPDNVDNAELAEFLNIWSTAAAKEFKKLYGSDYTKQIIDTAFSDGLTRDDMEKFMVGALNSDEVSGSKDIDILYDRLKDKLMDEDFMEPGEPTPWEFNDLFTDNNGME